MKDFKATVMMTKLKCICLPRAGDGWPSPPLLPTCRVEAVRGHSSAHSLTALSAGADRSRDWGGGVVIGLEEVLRRGAASAVSSLRGAFTSHKHTRTTTVWTEFHSSLRPSRCAQDEAPLHHCSGVNNCTHLNVCLKMPQIWSCKRKKFNLLSSCIREPVVLDVATSERCWPEFALVFVS